MAAAHAADPAAHLAQFRDLVLFLATAGVVVPLFKRLRISPTLGYLVAGVALGPQGLGALAHRVPVLVNLTVGKPEEVAQLAEFGVAFLLFTIGLELSWERLRSLRRLVFGLGALQVALCAAALAGATVLASRGWPEATVLGVALALSSTAVVLPALEERGRSGAPSGRAVFAVLLFQDLLVAPLLIVVNVLGWKGVVGPSALLAFVPALLGVAALLAAGRLLLRPLMRSVARAHSEDLFLAASLLVVIGSGVASAAAGLSMALGAFIAGLLLAETEFRHELENKVEPFKGLLLGLFFVSVGVGLDLRFTVSHLPQVLALATGFVAIKVAVVWGLARLFGLAGRQALETALALAAGGEFAFVLLTQARAAPLIPTGGLQAAFAAVTLSMFAAPFLVALGARLAGAGAQAAPDGDLAAPPPDASPEDRHGAPAILVVGYGRVGRLVCEMLDAHALAWVCLDRDPRAAARGRRDGKPVFFGDAADPIMLRRCGLPDAPALVLTMSDPDLAELVVPAARDLRADLTIVARARDARHAKRLHALGVTDAVPETIEASLQLSEAVLVDLGVPMGLVIASIHEKRDAIRRELDRPLALGARPAAHTDIRSGLRSGRARRAHAGPDPA